ncbi:hypothetical protein SBI_01167 [Streptomyces bingchenggensis BCW-1]|uniref:Uncharacterized protein n=1 Tax=Streptomyces bingchenggensis (strain BCW-1) TaxID=749414 RepID=D7C9W0_STRBB|nr:hypothetical protein SBI_01167 [Streptomyces bingchenggensis BCW-1]
MFPLGCGRDAVLFENAPHGGGGDLDTEGAEFAVHAPVAPAWILPYKSQNQEPDGADGTGPAAALGTGGLRVAVAEQVAVPAQESVRRDDQAKPAEPCSWEAV